jgi:two-component system LytT family response regulator
MPGRNGINIGALLREKNPKIKIFIVTSYLDYLDDAMEFHVFRYLSKPIDKARLFRNFKEALYQISMEAEKISIETKEETIICSSDEIVMIEKEDRRVIVHTLSRSLESVENAKYWDRLLKYRSFNRPHRSYIINLKYLQSYTHESIVLKTPDGRIWEAYIARRKYQEFKDAHLLFLEAMS